ncbi:MAG: hypothetical protein ACI9FB_002985 [Candidatus Azotimanducaceae bacterium]|jgi:hypothetical protein
MSPEKIEMAKEMLQGKISRESLFLILMPAEKN